MYCGLSNTWRTSRVTQSYQLPRPTDQASKKCHKLPQHCKFLDKTNCLPRLNTCSQSPFCVGLDTLLIFCTSTRFTYSPDFLLHHVQPNCKHEDINHCRHNGWHSSHWLSRYALSHIKGLATRLFCGRLELGLLASTELTYTYSLRSLL